MPEPIRPFTPSSPEPIPSGLGEEPRAGGVPPRALGGGVVARVEGVLAGAAASEKVFNAGLEMAHMGRAHATLIPHVWYIIGDSGSEFIATSGQVKTYAVDLLEPYCPCKGFTYLPRPLRADGHVCKHIVAAAFAFLSVHSKVKLS